MSLALIFHIPDPVSCAFHPLPLTHPSTICSLEGDLQSQWVRIPFAFERRIPQSLYMNLKEAASSEAQRKHEETEQR